MFTRNNGSSLIAILVVSVGVVSAGGVRYRHARPRELSGIPPRDYQSMTGPPARTVFAISNPAVVIPPAVRPGTATADPTALRFDARPPGSQVASRLYQFAPTSLNCDHCSVSRIAVVVQEDGSWRLNLRADQNPRPVVTKSGMVPTDTVPIRALPKVQTKQTAHLKRNLFMIKLRGLGSFPEPLATPPSIPAQGKPVLLALEPINFWVQNGVPYTLVLEGQHYDAVRFFDKIDRVEIEFTYR